MSTVVQHKGAHKMRAELYSAESKAIASEQMFIFSPK